MPRIPLIHLNGSSADELRLRYENVVRAILALADAIHQSAPNARDYYPLGEAAYGHARNEHHAQLAELDKLRIYYREMLLGIQEQIDKRDGRTSRIAARLPKED